MEPRGSPILGQCFATELILSQPLILDLNSWTMQWFAPSKVHAYELVCIYSTLVLLEDKVRVMRIGSMPSSAQLVSVLNHLSEVSPCNPWGGGDNWFPNVVFWPLPKYHGTVHVYIINRSTNKCLLKIKKHVLMSLTPQLVCDPFALHKIIIQLWPSSEAG